jgi:DMATS type aromatic prenyltransferase
MTAEKQDRTPADNVSQSLGFPNEDQEFWWRATAVSLGRLLANCRYSEEGQVTHLRWYHRFIIEALGPRPIPGVKPRFQPCPVFDGSACELSVNWKESTPERTVRFTIEATGFDAGTEADPFNQDETKVLLRKMARETPDIDLRRFDYFASKLFLSSQEAKTVVRKIPPGTPLSQVWVAFDLLDGKIMPKVYFMPVLKWISTDIPSKTLVLDLARGCNGAYGNFDASVDILNSYLNSFPPREAPVVEMVAIDCIDSPKSRIKIYLRTSVNTLARAKRAFTLGGRLSGDVIDEGLQALASLWPILFRLPSDHDVEDVEVFRDGSYCGNAIEMKPGHAEPEVKIHIPVSKIPGTDAQICESLSAWFRLRGHDQFAADYQKDLAAAL